MSERLTKKTSLNNLDGGKLYKVNADYSKCEDLDDRKAACSKTTSKIIDKLGQLEDAEKKLGIDLITLLKALKDGYYYISNISFGDGRIRFADHNTIELLPYDSGWLLHISVDTRLVDACRIEDYGKTWALTKEELK